MTERKRESGARVDVAELAMLLTVLIWAGNNIIVKGVVDTIAPLPYVFLRFLFVVVIVFGLYIVQGRIPLIPRDDLKWFMLTGLTGYALYNALFTAGLKYTTAFSTAVMISSAPLLTSVLARALGIEAMSRRQWAGFVLSLLGVAVFVSDKMVEGNPAWGDLLSFLAAISFAVYSLATRPIVQRHGSLMVTAWSSLIGLIIIAPVAAIPMARQDWGALGFTGWGAILYSSALSMLLAYTIWGWAIQRSGVARTALFLYLIPVLTGVLSFLVLDEAFGVMKILGALLVFAGVVMARMGSAHRLAPVEE
ncbi:MAG: DMT family transporter [Thermomicrobiales bacterium]|nr:DMT family transporter [Thermomicrobiales bacterium]